MRPKWERAVGILRHPAAAHTTFVGRQAATITARGRLKANKVFSLHFFFAVRAAVAKTEPDRHTFFHNSRA